MAMTSVRTEELLSTTRKNSQDLYQINEQPEQQQQHQQQHQQQQSTTPEPSPTSASAMTSASETVPTTISNTSNPSSTVTTNAGSNGSGANTTTNKTGTGTSTTNHQQPSTAGTTATSTTKNTVIETNTERSAVVLALFGPSVGPCVGDFSTTYNRVNGRLYASTMAILFYSNLFGFERRLCLQFADVEYIEAYRSTSIRVWMVDCEDYIFRRFSNRDSVLNLLQELLRRHDYPSEEEEQDEQESRIMTNNSAAAIHGGADENSTSVNNDDQHHSPIVVNRELRLPTDDLERSDDDSSGHQLRPHLNSEIIPEPMDLVASFSSLSAKENNNNSNVNSNNNNNKRSSFGRNKNKNKDDNNKNGSSKERSSRGETSDRNRPRSKSVPAPKRFKKHIRSPMLMKVTSPKLRRAKTSAALDTVAVRNDSIHSEESFEEFLGSAVTPVSSNKKATNSNKNDSNSQGEGRNAIKTKSGHQSTLLAELPPPGFDLRGAWEKAKIPYEETALETIRLSGSLDRFTKLFLMDDATLSIMKYQKEQIGDRDIEVSPWTRKESADGKTEYPTPLERSINFVHPLKNTVGPSEAKTVRTQTVRRFGSFGMTIQNVTVIEGVPAADCFRVEDRWIIEQIPTENDGKDVDADDSTTSTTTSGTTLTMLVSFRINFVKRTLFKPVIQKNIRTETGNWFRGFAKYVITGLSGNTDEAAPISTKTILVKRLDDVSQIPAPTPTSVMGDLESTNFDHTTSSRGYNIHPSGGIAGDGLAGGNGFFYFTAAILFLASLMFIQMILMQQSLLSMQSQMIELQKQNTQILTVLVHLHSDFDTQVD